MCTLIYEVPAKTLFIIMENCDLSKYPTTDSWPVQHFCRLKLHHSENHRESSRRDCHRLRGVKHVAICYTTIFVQEINKYDTMHKYKNHTLTENFMIEVEACYKTAGTVY